MKAASLCYLGHQRFQRMSLFFFLSKMLESRHARLPVAACAFWTSHTGCFVFHAHFHTQNNIFLEVFWNITLWKHKAFIFAGDQGQFFQTYAPQRNSSANYGGCAECTTRLSPTATTTMAGKLDLAVSQLPELFDQQNVQIIKTRQSNGDRFVSSGRCCSVFSSEARAFVKVATNPPTGFLKKYVL